MSELLGPALQNAFFAGIAGTGMSPLALYCRMAGAEVSGSDRSFDHQEQAELADKYRHRGLQLFPQDGSGITKNLSALIVSTAVEKENIEIKKATELGVPIMHRSEALAEIVRRSRTIAVAGTSGKSTTTALIHHLLYELGLSPGLYSGASSLAVEERTGWGQVEVGPGPLVIEADESDGTLVRYHPHYSIISNIQRDHKELNELIPLFTQFAEQTQKSIVMNGRDSYLREIAAAHPECNIAFFSPEYIRLSDGQSFSVDHEAGALSQTIIIDGAEGILPMPGIHNLENALSAIALLWEMGIRPQESLSHLHSFKGVFRRFQLVGQNASYILIDDFAHNPEKVRAALRTVRTWIHTFGMGKRLVAHFQPHGYGPLRMLAKDFMQVFKDELGADDLLFLSPVYDAGGSADRSYNTQTFVDEMGATSFRTITSKTRDELTVRLVELAASGDIILSMGARDPALCTFAKNLWKLISKE